MDKNQQIPKGAKLKYIGKGFENFQKDQPYMTFLGYDSAGWYDLWVDYLDQKICVNRTDVEIVGG